MKFRTTVITLCAAILLAVLLTTLAAPAVAQQYSQAQTKAILTQNDGAPCDPQHGADYKPAGAGCCGSPGNRECAYVLHFGKDSGYSPGCTDPDSNVLHWNSFDSKLLCNFDDAFAELPAGLILPAAKPAVRDFRFFVTSDLHFYRISYDVDSQYGHPGQLNLENSRSILQGHPYSAVIIPGDISTGPSEQRLGAYRALWERGKLPGSSIGLPVFFGLGNHDASTLGYFGAEATDAERMWTYLDSRMALQNIDTSPNGCLRSIDPGCLALGKLAGSHNYSWDWEGVHFVMLNTWAGDRDRNYSPPFGMDGMAWLSRDLQHFVGSSGRPVVMFQHYTLNDARDTACYPSQPTGCGAWSNQNKNDFINIIKPYNVIGLFSGHTHGLDIQGQSDAVNQPAGSGAPGTTLDNFVDGSAGDCSRLGTGDYQCSGAINNFLTVHISDKYMEVTAKSWRVGVPTYTDPNIGFKANASNDGGASCRKRIVRGYVDVTGRVTVASSGGKLTVTNKSGTVLTGLAAQTSDSALNDWDFTDSCNISGNHYLLLTDGALAPNQSVTVPYNANNDIFAGFFKVYQLGDSLVSSDYSPVATETSAQLQISTLTGASVPFTYRVDPYTSGDTTQWLGVSADSNTTPATFTFKAATLPSYAHTTASFTITPTDPNIAPITIPVTLSPANVSVTSNVSGATFRFDGNDTPLPFSSVVNSGTLHKIDVVSPQDLPSGIRYTFNSWSNGGPTLQNLNVPLGGTSLAANFDTSYKLTLSVAPALSGGFVVTSPKPTAGFLPPGPVHLSSKANGGYFFTGYSGDYAGTTAEADIILRGPLSITANFAANPTLKLSSSIPLSEAPVITLNGVTSPSPVAPQFAPGTVVSFSVPPIVVSAANPNVRYAFLQWDDGNSSSSRSLTMGTGSLSFTAQYAKQELVNVSVSPANVGTVTGGGWYADGSTAPLQATAAAGFQFAGFSGDISSSSNPFLLHVVNPGNFVANFAAVGTPQLFAAAAGAATDVLIANPEGTARALPISLKNVGPGGALNAQIDSVTNIVVVSGSGTVTPALNVPAVAGNLPVNVSGTTSVNFVWPATATRVRMTINFSANGGAYHGSTTLNLFR